LLRSEKRQATTNFGDRQLLKNLGHWLGMITIAKEMPIQIDVGAEGCMRSH
jgi:CCR4-NOT transcription complex subunit 1